MSIVGLWYTRWHNRTKGVEGQQYGEVPVGHFSLLRECSLRRRSAMDCMEQLASDVCDIFDKYHVHDLVILP